METQSWKGSRTPLVPCVFFLLVLVVLVCGMAESNHAGAQELEVEDPHQAHPRSVDYEIGVLVCGQTENLVPNAGFEAGIGVDNGWVEAGPCSFDIRPGHDNPESAQIYAGRSTNKSCMLLSLIDQIPLEADRIYDYSAWISATLEQGTAYLATTFWRVHNNTWKQVGEPVLTNQVASTMGDWVQVTGSARAPAEAEYARVEPSLAAYSAGLAWFDDVDLSLSTCLTITKRSDSDEVYPGDVLTYTIIYSNTGRGTATGCWVAEDYDEDVYLISTRTVPPPDVADHTWLLGNLGGGERGEITPVVRVRDVVENSRVDNMVNMQCDETLEPISAIDHTSLPTDVCSIDLQIPEKQSGEPGQTVSYGMTLRNDGGCRGWGILEASCPPGWTCERDPRTFTIKEDDKEPATLSLHIPENASLGIYEITVTATLECNLPCNSGDVDSETAETTVVSSVFLPLLGRNCHDRRWECHPNGTVEEACGPIESGTQYYGYTDDERDYWLIQPPAWVLQASEGRLVVDFTVDMGFETGVQILIVGTDNIPGCWDNTPEDGYSLDCPVENDEHFLLVFTAEPQQSWRTPYTILLSFSR